ncbi:MAG: iron export ABC transporter permease subunit FetB [Myxococcota bacterium]
MSGSLVVLSATDVAIGGTLVVVAGVTSVAARLGLEKRLAVAAVRTVVQLVLVGYILEFVFGTNDPVFIVGLWLLMTGIAALTVTQRASRRYPGMAGHAFATLFLACWLSTALVTQVVVGVEPWYRPQYVIPLLDMALGNSLTGVSLCLDTLLEAFDDKADEVELHLSLGATSNQAAVPAMREAIRKGMTPIINAMTVVGIVSLPGMMTGQILAGSPPLAAVLYQVVVMFMIAGATASGCLFAALLVRRSVFDQAHRLRLDRITRDGFRRIVQDDDREERSRRARNE